MRFYESTNFFLRVIVVSYYSKELDLTVKLIPMFHIGEKQFYDQALKEANDCDIVLYEGFDIKKTRIDKQLGRYSKIAEKLDLISQYEYAITKKIVPKLVRADVYGQAGETEWRKLKFKEQIKFRIIYPLLFRIDTYNMTRERLAKVFMHSAEEAYLAYGPIEEEGTLENLIHEVRDNVIKEKLETEIKKSVKCTKIGILYGAGHMRKVEVFLYDNYDFKIQKAKFLKVYHIAS